MRIYQAGSLSYLYKINEFQHAKQWRQEQKEKLKPFGFKFYDPSKCFEGEFKVEKINDASIVANNIHYLNKCNIIVLDTYHVDKSPGSMFECYWYYRDKKPVFSFGDYEYVKKVMSPHLNVCITQHFGSLEELNKYLVQMYRQLVGHN